MEKVIQRTSHDCAICSIAITTGVPYNLVKRAAKKRGGYRTQNKSGTKCDRIVNVLDEIGKKNFLVPTGSYFNISTALRGRKGILCWYNKETNIGHAVAWDGFNIICPSDSSPKKFSEKRYEKYLKETSKEWCSIVGVETSLLKRVLSLTYNFARSILY